MSRLDVYTVAIYVIFAALLLQNMLSIAVLATGINIPVAIFFGLKYAVLICAIGILLITKPLYSFRSTEMLTLAIIIFIVGLAVFRGGGLAAIEEVCRFYLAPVALFLLGRAVAPFKTNKQMAMFIMTISVLYVGIGLAFVLIDRQTLINAGLGILVKQRLSEIGRADEVYRGMPINFFYFTTQGGVINRAFGALVDPLESAFFGATLLFYLLEVRKRKVFAWAGWLAAGVGLLILMSMTRSIISGIVIVLLVSLIYKKGIAALPLWPILLVGAAISAYVAFNEATILNFLDPSSAGHLNAYLKLDARTSLVGQPFEVGETRGAESLYLTIFLECGILGLGLFVAWFGQLYRYFRKRFTFPYANASLAAMFVYLIASVTTEHWFIFSSCSLFWFLLGNNMTVIEQSKELQASVYRPAPTSSLEGQDECSLA